MEEKVDIGKVRGKGGWNYTEAWSLNTAGQLQLRRHSSRDDGYKTWASLRQTEPLYREGSWIHNPTLSCEASGKGETIFSDNAAPAWSVNVWWKTTPPRLFDQHKLFLKDLVVLSYTHFLLFCFLFRGEVLYSSSWSHYDSPSLTFEAWGTMLSLNRIL